MTTSLPRPFVSGMIALALALCLACPAAGEDWPTYRHDVNRTGSTVEEIKTPLHPHWVALPNLPPSPAWPEPVRERHMMDFDYANQVAIAGGVVYFGSTSEYVVRAVNLAGGRQKWCFYTEGPVRFAPTVAGGKVYVACDDGYAYCLNAADGALVWKFRGGPTDDRMIGNDHLISHWPLRSGLLVDGGVVYFTAGLWPIEGVWSYALKADDGAVVWKARAPEAFLPQGYLTATDKALLAPTGRTVNCLIDRSNGAVAGAQGFSWSIVKGNQVLSGQGTVGGNENLPAPGVWEFRPRPESITVWAIGAAPRRRGGGGIGGKSAAAVNADTCFAAGGGRAAALAMSNMAGKWDVAVGPTYAVAAAGATVIVGGKDKVTLLSAADGQTLWTGAVEGEARGLAVSGGRLVVSTSTGQIACFGPDKPPTVSSTKGKPVETDAAAMKKAATILKDSGVTAGYCLLVGAGDGQLAAALARQSNLRVVCLETNAKAAAAARATLDAAGLYGYRVAVNLAAPGSVPYPDYFADLVVVDGGTLSAADLVRVLHPYGGVAHFSAGAEAPKVNPPGFKPVKAASGAAMIVRSDLPGAGQWTHQYADAGNSAGSGDTLARWPVKVQWFGKPGPGQMFNRHLRGPAPLFSKGRLFILGQHGIMAVDAYNGRALWEHEAPALGRRVVDIRGGNMATDGDSVFVATGDICLRYNAADGTLRQAYRLPVARPSQTLDAPRTVAMDAAGHVTVAKTADGLTLTLVTADTKVTNANRTARPTVGDSWELFFDFRPADKRSGVYGPGAFQLIVIPATVESATPACTAGLYATAPPATVAGTLAPAGSTTALTIAWADIRKLAGCDPADFAFGAILNTSDNGVNRTGRVYRFANNASYRIANCWGGMVLDARRSPSPKARKVVPIDEGLETLAWGNLYVSDGMLLGTTVRYVDTPGTLASGWDFSSEGHDYTGPQVAQVLGMIGVSYGARHVFALDVAGGDLRWVYEAKQSVPHNGLAVWNRHVYVIDRTNADVAAAAARRGQPVSPDAKLHVLDLATGKPAWQIQQDGLADYNQVRIAHGVLVTASMRGMTAFDADDGKSLWTVKNTQPMHHCSAFLRAPVLTRKWVYDEPNVYDLRTGQPRRTGADANSPAWTWGNFRGCGTVSGGENLLFFRGGYPTLVDVTGSMFRRDIVGVRPGCYINMIVAGGLVLMPEASSGCGCPYSLQTTTVFAPQPAGQAEAWTK